MRRPSRGFAGILNAAPDVTKQVIIVIDVVSQTDTEARRCRRPAAVGCLVKQFPAQLQLRQQLVGRAVVVG